MKKHKVRLCRQAKAEHQKSSRQFAHSFHRPNVICVTPEFYDLPPHYQAGILLHEMGHLAYSQGERHTENDADQTAYLISGVHIIRRQYRDAKRLETVDMRDLREAQDFLIQHVDHGHMDEYL